MTDEQKKSNGDTATVGINKTFLPMLERLGKIHNRSNKFLVETMIDLCYVNSVTGPERGETMLYVTDFPNAAIKRFGRKWSVLTYNFDRQKLQLEYHSIWDIVALVNFAKATNQHVMILTDEPHLLLGRYIAYGGNRASVVREKRMIVNDNGSRVIFHKPGEHTITDEMERLVNPIRVYQHPTYAENAGGDYRLLIERDFDKIRIALEQYDPRVAIEMADPKQRDENRYNGWLIVNTKDLERLGKYIASRTKGKSYAE